MHRSYQRRHCVLISDHLSRVHRSSQGSLFQHWRRPLGLSCRSHEILQLGCGNNFSLPWLVWHCGLVIFKLGLHIIIFVDFGDKIKLSFLFLFLQSDLISDDLSSPAQTRSFVWKLRFWHWRLKKRWLIILFLKQFWRHDIFFFGNMIDNHSWDFRRCLCLFTFMWSSMGVIKLEILISNRQVTNLWGEILIILFLHFKRLDVWLI